MSEPQQVWVYIGRTQITDKHHPAETVVAATVDRPERAKENAKEVAKWMRAGLAIERVPVEWVRKFLLTTEPYLPTAPPVAPVRDTATLPAGSSPRLPDCRPAP